jgi:DNA-binding response OmpR family regulator
MGDWVMSSQRVLVVDDEKSLLEVVSYALKEAGYKVATATDATEAEVKLKQFEPQLMIMDLRLPDGSGFELCRLVRSITDIPVIILSAKTDEVDKVLGLELGADDYVTKPFSPRELVSRVRAHLRRGEQTSNGKSSIIIKDLKIDVEGHQVFLNDKPVYLTNGEFQILTLLAKSPGKVLSRLAILNHLWGAGYVGDNRTVDVHIHNLRDKLEADPQDPKYLVTVRGQGYRLSDS